MRRGGAVRFFLLSARPSQPEVPSATARSQCTMIPSHLPDAARNTLIQYHFEAIHAAIFGAPRAALAMCRSLTECILWEFYAPDLQPDDERSAALSKLIDAAEKVHEWIGGLNLRKRVNVAHSVVHARPTQLTDAEAEDEVVQFVRALRDLIGRADSRKP
jgi:hypothetical protein